MIQMSNINNKTFISSKEMKKTKKSTEQVRIELRVNKIVDNIISTNSLNELCEKDFEDLFKLQSFEDYDFNDLKCAISTYSIEKILKKHNSTVKLIEDVVFTVAEISRARCGADLMSAVIMFMKFRCGGESLMLHANENLMIFNRYISLMMKRYNVTDPEAIFNESQYSDNVSETDSVMYFSDDDDYSIGKTSSGETEYEREKEMVFDLQMGDDQSFCDKAVTILGMYKTLRFGPLFGKVQGLTTTILAMSLLKPLGYDLTSIGYTRAEKELMEAKVWKSDEPTLSIIESVLYLCSRGSACVAAGSISPLLHSGGNYEGFYINLVKLRRWNAIIDNVDLCKQEKLSEQLFFDTLEKTIAKGESINKFQNDCSSDKHVIGTALNELYMMRITRMTLDNAQKSRKCPFSMLVYGDSGVGKTSVLALLETVFAKTRGLPLGDEFRYTKNADSNYWDGFRSKKWYVLFDDVAYLKPGVASGVDPTVAELLKAGNNVTFVPDQAKLEDKGKHPFRAELILASTNTPHLNAFHYFSAPAAVQRRLPFILDVEVKPEYRRNDGTMLDSTKCLSKPGMYDDYWVYTVEKIIPTSTRGHTNTLANKKKILHKVSQRDFLKWYIGAIEEHFANQEKVMESMDNTESVKHCDSCHLPDYMCACLNDLQTGESIELNTVREKLLWFNFTCMTLISTWFISCGISSDWFSWFCQPWVWTLEGLKFTFVRFAPNSVIDYFMRQQDLNRMAWYTIYHVKGKQLFKGLGTRLKARFPEPKTIVMVMTCAYIIRKYLKMRSNKKIVKQQKVKSGPGIFVKTIVGSLQSLNPGVQIGVKDEVHENVWCKEIYQLTTMDVGSKTLGWRVRTREQVAALVASNIVTLRLKIANGNRITKATCLKGQLYVCNNHFFRDVVGDASIEVETVRPQGGVSPNINIVVNIQDTMRDTSRDLIFFEIKGIPPRRDITDLLPKDHTFEPSNGGYFVNNTEGNVEMDKVKRIKRVRDYYCHPLKLKIDSWHVIGAEGKYGNCGSLLISDTHYGPVWCGVHYLGHEGALETMSIAIDQVYINTALAKFDKQVSQGEYEIGPEGYKVPLKDLNKHSTFRFVEEGTANVFGTLEGGSQRGKSSVMDSPIGPYLQDYGYEIKFTKPTMRGWMPWRLAVVDMTNTANKFLPSKIIEAADGYCKRVVRNVGEQLKNLRVINNFTAINGASGVTYIDGINRNSSMGFPYYHSKKQHLHEVEPQCGLQNPVMFDKEIMHDVDRIEGKYRRGERTNPVFVASLKDEPVSEEKSRLGKTRVFAAAPIAWSLVVRKYLLSLVRVIQMNQHVFECACGIACQSKEWTQLYSYVTTHGKKRMVGGDFSKFDKKMSSEMIQAAFDIIRRLCSLSGNYDETDLLVIKGIGLDVSFAWMNFNGDLVEFFGSNPSGHPLTVIINSIVNSLYMRMAFADITKLKVDKFDDYVSLITYGDDNLMSVSEKAVGFDHTSIQDYLGRYGVKYTMADKESKSQAFIDIKDCSFLKRRWEWNDEAEAFFAPLEHESIEKMLMVWVKSKTIGLEEQSIAVMNSASNEYFFYGRMIHERRLKMFQTIIQACELKDYVEEYHFPTFDQCLERFKSIKRQFGELYIVMEEDTVDNTTVSL